MKGRQVFLDSILLHGATKIFGNPGTTETPMLDSLHDYPDIEYIVALHEGIAVGAGSFYAQASGKTAVANMHVAPGLGNAIGMMYGALKANSPMIVTAGAQDTRLRMRDPLLGHDLVAMAAPVVKWSVEVSHADEMASIMQRAFKIANEHPKGPVFVALPINVMEQETDFGATVAGLFESAETVPASGLERLATMLAECDSPGIVISDDVARGGATDALVGLAEKVGAGVHSELLSVHVNFPRSHPHYRGRLGADHAGIRRALGNYDLVLLIGGPFFEEVWYTPTSPFADNACIVQIEAGPSTLAHNFPLALGLSGNIAEALTRLDDLVATTEAGAARSAALMERHAAAEKNAADRLEALWDRSPMTPARAMHELGAALPNDVILTDESITAVGDVTRNFRQERPHDGYAGRGGGIGQGLAGAPGVAVAHPGRQIVCVSGDGSAMYSIQALWTAAHHNLRVIFVILSNREYRVLKHNVDQYRNRFDVPSNSPYPHMDLSGPVMSFKAMAEGMGVPGVQLATPGDIRDAVAEALAADGPYLIDLVVEGLETR